MHILANGLLIFLRMVSRTCFLPRAMQSNTLFYMFSFTQLKEEKTRSTNLEGALQIALQPQSALMLFHSAMEIRKQLQKF